MIGEIGLFAPDHERTTSAVCETSVVALMLTEDKVLQLYYQNPRFGFSLLQLVIRRLLADWSGTSRRPGPRRGPSPRPGDHASLGGSRGGVERRSHPAVPFRSASASS